MATKGTEPSAAKSEQSAKHGIHVREHTNWNTKTVYNNGHVMRIYRRQPKAIRFSSPMVNDFNQHLCGGWSLSGIEDEEEATVNQLIQRRKPFASITYWHYQSERARRDRKRLEDAGLVTLLRRRPWQGWNCDHVLDVVACQNMRVRDIGNLDDLRNDYAPIFTTGLDHDEIESFADVPLTTFFEGWDSPPLPLWLTGLILGYPIENTISLYLE